MALSCLPRSFDEGPVACWLTSVSRRAAGPSAATGRSFGGTGGAACSSRGSSDARVPAAPAAPAVADASGGLPSNLCNPRWISFLPAAAMAFPEP